MDFERRKRLKLSASEPRRTWTDWLARRLRVVGTKVGLPRLYELFVPLLFAVFVAAPIGVLILPFFVPKFVRNGQRRRKYRPHLSSESVPRIAGEPHTPTRG